MGWDVLCAPELCRRSATPGQGLAHPDICVPGLDSCGTLPHWMGWHGMVWYGDLTGWDWKGLMRWDGSPHLGKRSHTQIDMCLGLDRLRHPSTPDGMAWYVW